MVAQLLSSNMVCTVLSNLRLNRFASSEQVLVNIWWFSRKKYLYGRLQLNGLVQDGRKWLFWVIFVSFKSAWTFACTYQLSKKNSPVSFFWLKCSCSALLRSLCTLRYFEFVFLRSKVQTSQKIQGNVLLLKVTSNLRGATLADFFFVKKMKVRQLRYHFLKKCK